MSAKTYRSEKLNELKAQLKDIAGRIRANRKSLKEYQREHGGSHGPIGFALWKLQREYRHKHIAYCLLRGRSMDQIEKPRDENAPDMTYVNRLIEEYTDAEEKVA